MGEKKILLVDDSAVIQGVVANFLSEKGLEIITADNGVEAIQKAYTELPDLIIMDVEMPLLKGYQASRLLKSRRGIKEIPIVMHTTLSENRDKFWGKSSGADLFINKDFDNLEELYNSVLKLADHPAYDLETIKKDAEKITSESIFELLSNLLDQRLFQSTILNELGEMVKNVGVESTANEILTLSNKVCEHHIAVIYVNYNKNPIAYVYPSDEITEQDIQDFTGICLNDFSEHFDFLNWDGAKQIIVEKDKAEVSQMRSDKKTISSYNYQPLIGKGEKVIGSIHFGNFSNNYFSNSIVENIKVFTKGASPIIENAILFEQLVEMQDKIRNVFSKFVPAEIIDDLVERQSVSALLTGENREVAVLFSDIRSFTSISENNSPEGIVKFLNNYFEVMVDIITQHGGSIDKFIGDAILAVFGAPKSYEDNAKRAVQSAVEMINSLPKVDVSHLKLPNNTFNIGIGIHEGIAIVGNIGSKAKFDYTVIGDTVNLASRLEGLTKHYKSRILVSEVVKNKVDPFFKLREADAVKVKGKDLPTKIFRVEDPEDIQLSEEALKNYKKALSMYSIKNWQTAIEYFSKVLEDTPNDPVSKMYIERCKHFMKNPPPENWDGTMDLDFK